MTTIMAGMPSENYSRSEEVEYDILQQQNLKKTKASQMTLCPDSKFAVCCNMEAAKPLSLDC